MRFSILRRVLAVLLFASLSATAASAFDENKSASEDIKSGEVKKDDKWLIESPPGPQREQPIDVSEGTWLTVDVSPDGKEIVFDLLGDLYVMPIGGADGAGGKFPKKLTSGIAWDMQPRFSHDGEWIAFTSDRNGKSGRAGDNIWVISRSSKELKQVTDEAFRLTERPGMVAK